MAELHRRHLVALRLIVWVIIHGVQVVGMGRELLAAMTPKIAVISSGRWDFGKHLKKKEKPKQLTTFAFGPRRAGTSQAQHPRRSTIDMLVLAIPGEREQATKQVVFDAVHKKPPYAEDSPQSRNNRGLTLNRAARVRM